MADAIACQYLTKYYSRRCVVDSLNLNVPVGCVYGLLGRNGSGKSTTIKMLTGMVHPDAGSAQLLGEEVGEMKPALRSRISYVAEGHPLPRWMSVGDAVNFTRRFYRQWNDELVQQILEHFSLPRRAKIRRLSKGQQAQVSLALALATEPALLILDDPTLGLDTVVRRDFLESMIHLIQREGRTILFSSHILGDVERVADRIGIMVDGVLRVDCPTERFKEAVTKVVMQFSSTPPPPPRCTGVVSSWQVGARMELVIIDFTDEHRRVIESLGPCSWDVIELSLEDAFIEYTRGHKRSLPLFLAEESYVEVADSQRIA